MLRDLPAAVSTVLPFPASFCQLMLKTSPRYKARNVISLVKVSQLPDSPAGAPSVSLGGAAVAVGAVLGAALREVARERLASAPAGHWDLGVCEFLLVC